MNLNEISENVLRRSCLNPHRSRKKNRAASQETFYAQAETKYSCPWPTNDTNSRFSTRFSQASLTLPNTRLPLSIFPAVDLSPAHIRKSEISASHGYGRAIRFPLARSFARRRDPSKVIGAICPLYLANGPALSPPFGIPTAAPFATTSQPNTHASFGHERAPEQPR